MITFTIVFTYFIILYNNGQCAYFSLVTSFYFSWLPNLRNGSKKLMLLDFYFEILLIIFFVIILFYRDNGVAKNYAFTCA
jgi:hypothetical protein